MARKNYKPETIIDKVESHYDATEPLRNRMDKDYSLYRLDPYDAGDGYQSYTSNEPSTYADKIISFVVQSEMVARIPNISENEEDRDANNMKERFFLGALRSADERIKKASMPSIKNQLGWYICMRGWYAGRALLVKDKEEETYVDITPWDPMHTYWSAGANGLEWACYKIKKSKELVEAQYNIKLPRNEQYDDEDWVDVYDYYDKEMNTVVLSNGRVAKKPTPHGSPRVPVFLGPVGSAPMIQALNDMTPIDDTIADYGESVFKHNRENYEKNNLMMSIMLELTARARRQGLKITSRDGMKTLDEDPYKEGTEISLAQGENVEPLGLMEVARETGAFMGLVSGETQRGSIPHTLYGDIQFQLSGFAINTLRQGIDSVISPRIKAMEDAYTDMCMLIVDQYLTESFDAMELSGQDMNRQYFKDEISPDSIKKAGDIIISFVGQLPQDDMSKMSMAQIAREGESPLLPDIFIRDKILGLQDTDQIDDAIREQQAEKVLPEAALWTLLKAAEDRGRSDLAQFYYSELLTLMTEKESRKLESQMALQQQLTGQPPMGGGPTADPRVAPNAMMGVPPPTPTPQAGAVVPPGTPRPGAQSEEERIRRAGLNGMRGA
tara:strand:+ start:1876 stop:3708 length:1833 start_codon:yes stop_codon:yes gene_type:complete